MSKKHKKHVQPAAKKQAKNPLIWIIPLGLLVVAIAAFIFLQQGNQATAQTSQALEVSVDEAHAKYQSGVFLLDVRTPEEWQEIHVPDTTLIPLNELASRLSELPRDQEIVVICRSGNRSQEGRDILLNAGFSSVSSMAGGVKDWAASGYPTTAGP